MVTRQFPASGCRALVCMDMRGNVSRDFDPGQGFGVGLHDGD